MIDYIKALLPGINISELLNNPHLNFCVPVNLLTGEMRSTKRNGKKSIPYKNAYYKGLEFRIYDSGTVYLLGSLHVYWNNGEHNFNDFNLLSVNEVLQDIQEKFNIKPENIDLRQLEIGINICPHYPTEAILKNCFMHVTELFKWISVSNEGKYIQAEHSQYIIKIYDKARHYRKKGFDVGHSEILRFEIKYKKLEKLKNLGVFTLQNLIDYGLEKFVEILVQEWQKVLFYDFTIDHDSILLLNYKNPLYWHELKERRSAFDKHKSKYKDIVKNYSDNVSLKVENLIREKCILMTRGATFDQNCQVEKNMQGTNIDSLYIGSILVPPPIKSETKLCPITGIDISMQREKSKYLSHKGLKYYFENNKKFFDLIKRMYLTKIWYKSDIQTQIKEISHNIRNCASHRNRKRRGFNPPGQLRFDF